VTPANIILTGIHDPDAFVGKCPTGDAAYSTIRQDFEMLSDGVPSTTSVTCTEPYTTTAMTEELLEWQTFRLAFYMSQGTAGKLPWTALSL
jgi:hypothetical protein